MLLLILAVLSTFFHLHNYLKTRLLRYLWATAFFLFLTGLKIHHEFFVPSEVFYDRLGWVSIPLAIFMVLGLLSMFWVCFAPIKQQTEPKKTRRWRSSIR